MLKTLVAFILVFSIIVLFHEWGHYYFAKRAGILVREFALGMGPKLYSFKKGETVYTLRALPIGGYVRMAGLGEEDYDLKPGRMVLLQENTEGQVVYLNLMEDDQEGSPFQLQSADLIDDLLLTGYFPGQEDLIRLSIHPEAMIKEPDGNEVQIAPRARMFQSANVWARFLTNIAGPINNFILAIVTFILAAVMTGYVYSTGTQVGDISPNSPAQSAGLVVGDQILSINGQKVSQWQEIAPLVQSQGPDLSLQVQRQDQVVELTLKAEEVTVSGTSRYQIGISPVKSSSWLDFILYGFSQTWAVVTGVLATLIGLFKNFSLNQLGGPVAVVSLTNQVVKSGFIPVLNLMGLLSANLGVMNLLPIPALDGGKLVLNLLEAIRKKPLDQEKEGMVTLVGAILLILLMVLVTWNDLTRLF